MNPPWPETDLVLLSNAFWLLAVIAVAFAAVSVIGVLALALAEWRRGRRHRRGFFSEVKGIGGVGLESIMTDRRTAKSALKVKVWQGGDV